MTSVEIIEKYNDKISNLENVIENMKDVVYIRKTNIPGVVKIGRSGQEDKFVRSGTESGS